MKYLVIGLVVGFCLTQCVITLIKARTAPDYRRVLLHSRAMTYALTAVLFIIAWIVN